MDPSDLAPLVMPWLIRFAPPVFEAAKTYGEKALETVAEKALEKAGEKITDESWQFGKPLLKKLLARIAKRPAALEAVEDLARQPDNSDNQTVMKVQLAKLFEADRELAAEIEQLVTNANRAGITINITASGDRSVAAQNINAPVITGDIKTGK
ncbi:MAG: hypothetical protein IPM66_15860 [Acidobacteriota bacterium]|nr:MAG: hypothetical protein IPM66_15860 [Acidobacteriota bacterium]